MSQEGLRQKIARLPQRIAEYDTALRVKNLKRSKEYRNFDEGLNALIAFAWDTGKFTQVESNRIQLLGNMNLVTERQGDGYKRSIIHGQTERLEIDYDSEEKPNEIAFSVEGEEIVSLSYSKKTNQFHLTNPKLAFTRNNFPNLKERYAQVSVESTKLINSYLLGMFPTPKAIREDKPNLLVDHEAILRSLSAGERAVKTVTDEFTGAEGKVKPYGIHVYNYYGDLLQTFTIDDLKGDDLPARQKRKYLEYLDQFRSFTRRAFLRNSATASLALILAACGGFKPTLSSEPSTNNKEIPLTDDEWNKLMENGVVERFTNGLMDDVYNDMHLTEGTKGLLYAHFGAKETASTVRGMWRKVATPDFLKTYGIFSGSDIKTVLQTREVNGGFAFFDRNTNTYAKFIPIDSYQGKYLRESYPSWKVAWETIGMPEEMTARIQIMGASKGSGVFVGGKEYIVLTTPQAGFATLDSYFTKKLMPQLGLELANARVLQLLEDYYLNVLFPINQKGIIQRDINWRNMVVKDEGSAQRLIPIDLDGANYMIDKRMLARWQYEQLADRAGRRGVNLLKFEDFVAKYPEKFSGLPSSIGNIKAIQIKIGGMPVKVIIPAEFTAGMKGDVMGDFVEQIATKITAQYRAVPQGGIISFELETAAGKQTMSIIKTTAFGDKIIGVGGRLGETIKFISSATKVASNVLLVWWIASEIGQIINPNYDVSFQSDVAFPDNVIGLQKDTLSLWVDGAFNRLINAKRRLADVATTIINADSPEVEGIFDVDKRSLLRCITEYGMTQPDIAKILQAKANSSLFPAPSDVQFTEPFPILIPGAREPINAYFSAVTDDEDNQLVVMWESRQDKSIGESSLVPLVAFHKKKNESKWSSQLLTDKKWSLEMSLASGYNMKLECRADDKGIVQGDKVKLYCEIVK